MRSREELLKKLEDYGESWHYIYDPKVGYIVFGPATGNNLEVMFFEALEPGKGQGLKLYRIMMAYLQRNSLEPYHSVHSYLLESNQMATRFYTKLGWTLVYLGQSIYKGDKTVLVWITWEELIENLKEQSDEDNT